MNCGAQNNLITFKDGGEDVCMVTPPGQSGFVTSEGDKSHHYDDQLALYETFECRPQALLRDEVEKVAVDRVSFVIKARSQG